MDASEAFEEFSNNHPYGGDLSVRFPCTAKQWELNKRTLLHPVSHTVRPPGETCSDCEGVSDDPFNGWKHRPKFDHHQPSQHMCLAPTAHRLSGKCNCWKPLFWQGQDESACKAHSLPKAIWVINSVSSLRKKSEGPGRHACFDP